VHIVGPVHDTPDSQVWTASGFGLGTIVQMVPSHLSINVPDAFAVDPTATHAVELAHDTPERTVFVDAGGFGLGTIDQEVPSHDSINVWVPDASVANPTAVHAVGLVHEMPLNSLSKEEDVSGLGTTDQVVPSHDSIRVRWAEPVLA
jgi:hypothetical protein